MGELLKLSIKQLQFWLIESDNWVKLEQSTQEKKTKKAKPGRGKSMSL